MTTVARRARGSGKYCSNECKYTYRVRSSGLTYTQHQPNPTAFRPGQIPWNKGKRKGQQL